MEYLPRIHHIAALQQSPIASKSPEMPIASGKTDSRLSINPNSFHAASTSQVSPKDAYHGGLKEEQHGNLTHEKEHISEESKDNSDVPEARLGILPCTHKSSKKKTWLHSTFPRRNGYSRMRQQKNRRSWSL